MFSRENKSHHNHTSTFTQRNVQHPNNQPESPPQSTSYSVRNTLHSQQTPSSSSSTVFLSSRNINRSKLVLKNNSSKIERTKTSIQIIGKNSDPELEFIAVQSENWKKDRVNTTADFRTFSECISIEIFTLNQTNFEYILKDLQRKSSNVFFRCKNQPIILVNRSRYLSSLTQLIVFLVNEMGFPIHLFVRSAPYTFDEQNELLLKLTQNVHSKLIQWFHLSEVKSYVYLDIRLKNASISLKTPSKTGGHTAATQSNLQKQGSSTSQQATTQIRTFRLIIQLNSKMMPKTCFNFYQLCQGNFRNKHGKLLCYKNSKFHGIQKNAFIQGGILADNDLNTKVSDESVFGDTFEDESYFLKHDQPGIIGMANQGRPHTNASQFYITLSSQPDMDQKYVAFGQVVFGMKYLRKINRMANANQIPFEVNIVGSGEYMFDRNDFIKESKKDFEFLDNYQTIEDAVVQAKHEQIEGNEIFTKKYKLPYLGHSESQQLGNANLPTSNGQAAVYKHQASNDQLILQQNQAQEMKIDKIIEAQTPSAQRENKSKGIISWIANQFEGKKDPPPVAQTQFNLLNKVNLGNKNQPLVDFEKKNQISSKKLSELISPPFHKIQITPKKNTEMSKSSFFLPQIEKSFLQNSPQMFNAIQDQNQSFNDTRVFRKEMKILNQKSPGAGSRISQAENSVIFDFISKRIMQNNQDEPNSHLQISEIKFLAYQYSKKQAENNKQELMEMIPEISESIFLQLPVSLKKSIINSSQQSSNFSIEKSLKEQSSIQLPFDKFNFQLFISQQLFDKSEIDPSW